MEKWIIATHAEPEIEARCWHVFVANMPFAGQSGAIAGLLQEQGKSLLRRQPAFPIKRRRDVIVDSMLRGRQPCQQRSACRGTNGCRRKGILHDNTGGSQAVKVWRAHLMIAVWAARPLSMVVGDEEQDVG